MMVENNYYTVRFIYVSMCDALSPIPTWLAAFYCRPKPPFYIYGIYTGVVIYMFGGVFQYLPALFALQ